MKPLAAVLLLALASCAPAARRADPGDREAQELAIVMALAVQETTQLKVGQWALYSVRTAGSTTTLSTRLAIVAAEGGLFWVENRSLLPSSGGTRPRTMISKYQIDASARPLQLWMGELGTKTPTKVFPGKDAYGNPIEPPKPQAPGPRAKVDVTNERITLTSGRSYDCTRLTSKVTYPDGRETTLVTWSSPEVPYSIVFEGKSYGGVVRRTYGTHTLELAAMGTDAVAELVIPEK